MRRIGTDDRQASAAVMGGRFCVLCGSWCGQLGLEPDPELYVRHLVEVFREVKRVLRDDGTLWLNLGDSYAGTTQRSKLPPEPGYPRDTGRNKTTFEQPHLRPAAVPWLKPKDLVGVPWRVAFALQKDGWWLRSDIVWSKPNPMPESVGDRPTKAHEYVFLLARSRRYFYDALASAESVASSTLQRCRHVLLSKERFDPLRHKHAPGIQSPMEVLTRAASGVLERRTRNRRTVWTIPTQQFRGAHFAVFPEALVKPCVLAGTSERGCCAKCGAPWRRRVRKRIVGKVVGQNGPRVAEARRDSHLKAWPVRYEVQALTTGWGPGCGCKTPAVPCVVLDPFCGSGTTGLVALEHGRSFVGIDVKPEYVEMAKRRLAAVKRVTA